MSFTKILYRLIIPDKITISLADIPKIIDFARELSEGKYLKVIEKQEFEKFGLLTQRIEEKADLMPFLVDLLKGKKSDEIKEALLEHRAFVHTLYYNKAHVLSQLSKIIDELEVRVLMEERATKSGYKIISDPQVNYARINSGGMLNAPDGGL